jgi:hypothetical protein
MELKEILTSLPDLIYFINHDLKRIVVNEADTFDNAVAPFKYNMALRQADKVQVA